MHARIDQLLSLRDGEPVDAAVERHLAECHPCAVELSRLRQMQQRLQQLDSFAPPPRVSPGGVDAPSAPVSGNGHLRRRGWAIAAGCVLAVGIGLALRDHGSASQQNAAAVPAPNAPVSGVPASNISGPTMTPSAEVSQPKRNAASLERLMAQSQHLDDLLLALPERSSIERVAQAATLDTLEHRIQWLDEQLSYAPEHGLNDSQAYRLWRERVDLMDSLVKVRYAEGQRLNF